MTDDDLERRLRGALGRARPGDAADAEEFLARVHHGAKVRRVKRGVSVAAVTVLAVTGGGLAINAGGLLGGSKTPMAADHTAPSTGTGSSTSDTSPSTTAPKRSKESVETLTSPMTVTISPNGPIAAEDVHVVSLTATGSDHQWVLAETPGDGCASATCATVLSTADHAKSWTDLGQLPAPPATTDTAAADSVSQLRFAKRQDGSGVYDGWAFGNALWTTHDSGSSWSNATAPPGSVTQLEAWGDYVYAGVSSAVLGDDTATLYRSPITADAWEPVPVTGDGPGDLTSVQSLAAAKNVLGLIDVGSGGHPVVYVSRDGSSWQRTQPCPDDSPDAVELSTASDGTGEVGALWVTCQGLDHTVIRVTDTRHLGTWGSVPNDSFPPAVKVAAQSPTLAYVAGDGVPGIQRVSTTKPAETVPAVGVGPPVFFGFTNPTHGYLLDASGHMLSTINSGTDWSPYEVTDTP